MGLSNLNTNYTLNINARNLEDIMQGGGQTFNQPSGAKHLISKQLHWAGNSFSTRPINAPVPLPAPQLQAMRVSPKAPSACAASVDPDECCPQVGSSIATQEDMYTVT